MYFTLNMMIERLSWDSNFFKLEIANAKIDNLDDYMIVKSGFAKSKYDLMYLFCPESTSPETLEIIKSNEKLHDTKLTFTKKKFATQEVSKDIKSVIQLSPALEDLAIQSGAYSRFNRDKILREKFPLLYKTWIAKSVNRDIADIVFGHYRSDGKLSGMVTLKAENDWSKIGLISVNKLDWGLGIGKKLIRQAENWCITKGRNELIVDTQEVNTKASPFYRACGFELLNKIHIFHIWK